MVSCRQTKVKYTGKNILVAVVGMVAVRVHKWLWGLRKCPCRTSCYMMFGIYQSSIFLCGTDGQMY